MSVVNIADDVALLLESRALGVLTEDLFINWVPARPDDCIAVIERSGPTGTYAMGPSESLPKMEYLSVQVWVRSRLYDTGLARMWAIHRVLQNYAGDMGDHTYALVRERYAPSPMGLDESRRSTFVGNYVAMRHP
jgi:hypothetical protein